MGAADLDQKGDAGRGQNTAGNLKGQMKTDLQDTRGGPKKKYRGKRKGGTGERRRGGENEGGPGDVGNLKESNPRGNYSNRDCVCKKETRTTGAPRRDPSRTDYAN